MIVDGPKFLFFFQGIGIIAVSVTFSKTIAAQRHEGKPVT